MLTSLPTQWANTQSKIEGFYLYLKLLFGNYMEDKCQATAAALTYQTLFAVVPLLTISFTVLDWFEAFGDMGDGLRNFMFNNFLPDTVLVVEEYLQEFSDQARSLSVPSIVVLVVTAFLLMFTIERSFNQIWRVSEPRQGFQRILMYWAILTLGPVMVGAGIAITTYLFSLPLLSDVTLGAAGRLIVLLPIMMNAFVFTLMYAAIPNCWVPMRHALIGGLVVAIGFEMVKQLFGTVMAATDFQVIYGTYAAVPLFLIWLYVSWTIILFGAELTKGIYLFRSHSSKVMEPPLIQILILLEQFFRSHQQGEVVSDRQIAALSRRVDLKHWHEYKSQMLSLGLIRSVDKGGLVLSKDLNEMTLWQLYDELPWPLPDNFNESSAGWETSVNTHLVEILNKGQKTLDIELEELFRGEVKE